MPRGAIGKIDQTDREHRFGNRIALWSSLTLDAESAVK
jgi:hypothetical protein